MNEIKIKIHQRAQCHEYGWQRASSLATQFMHNHFEAMKRNGNAILLLDFVLNIYSISLGFIISKLDSFHVIFWYTCNAFILCLVSEPN